MTSDEQIIDLFAAAAERGTPRGSGALWTAAVAAAHASPSRASHRTAVVAIAAVAVGMALGVTLRLDRDPSTSLSSSSAVFAVPTDLPDGWQVVSIEPGGQVAGIGGRIRVFGDADATVVATEFETSRSSLIWSLPQSGSRPVVVAGHTGSLSEASAGVQGLAVLTLDGPNDTQARFVARNVDEGQLVQVAGGLLRDDGAAPDGMTLRYDGDSATGPLASGSPAQVLATGPGGTELAVLTSDAPFVDAATAWYATTTQTVAIGDARGLLLDLDDQRAVIWQFGDRSVLVSGEVDGTFLLEVARSVRFESGANAGGQPRREERTTTTEGG